MLRDDGKEPVLEATNAPKLANGCMYLKMSLALDELRFWEMDRRVETIIGGRRLVMSGPIAMAAVNELQRRTKGQRK